MLPIGIDVHQKSSVFNVFDPNEGGAGGKHRSQKVETTAEGFRRVLEPLAGRCDLREWAVPELLCVPASWS